MSEDDGFSDALEAPNMEIQIDTLMGTSFDMRVSATDTVREIKQRIQRVEGIPIHQQNLIFQSQELKDSRRLCDAGIVNGSIIKLVLSMKGGPISTRRLTSLTCEHHVMLKELKELLENTRDEMGEKLTPGSKVSVLVFKEGEILNLLRVIENEDGSYSPYSEKTVAPPTKPSRKEMFEKFVEHIDMTTKISNLRKKMEDVSLKKQQSRGLGKEDSRMSYALLNDSSSDVLDLKIFDNHDELDDSQSECEESALKDKHRVRAKKLYTNKSLGAKQNYARIHKKARENTEVCSNILTRLVLDRPKTSDIEVVEEANTWEIHEPVSDRSKHGATCKLGVIKRGNYCAIPPEYAPKEEDFCDYYFSNNKVREPLYGRNSSRIQRLTTTNEDEKSVDLYGYYNLGCGEFVNEAKEELPPVVKKKSRCNMCNKRLNITNIYNCRCGKIFCSQHRYSEVHHCSYDYKTEGRRILEHQNPLVTAEKIHRI